MTASISRRRLLQGAGAIVIGFSLAAPARRGFAAPEQPEDPKWSAEDQRSLTPELDGWLKIAEDGQVTLFTGRVEIGNGILTALQQIVADELDVPFDRISIVSGDTDQVPNQGITSATTTIGVAAVVIRQAAATARHALFEMAAEELGVPAGQLQVRDGVISGPDGGAEITYADLIGGRSFVGDVDMEAKVKAPDAYLIVGQPIHRIDIPPKVTGAEGDFIENSRLEGMRFARILRPPAYGAKLVSYEEAVAEQPGIVAVIPIRHPGDERLARVERYRTMPGDFIAVVAEREDLALAAVERLRASVEWETAETLPTTHEELYDWLLTHGEPIELIPSGDPGTRRETFDELYQQYETRVANAAETFTQSYRGPFHCHGPIAPAFSLADVRGEQQTATIWSSSQWPFGARYMAAQALGYESEAQVRLISGSSSGLYGRREDHDQEVDVEAAILSQEVGAPVRLQWSRGDEFVWGPYRPPQIVELTAALDADNRIDGLYGRIRTTLRGDYPVPGIAAMGLQDTPYVLGPLPLETFNAGPSLRTGFMRNVFTGYNLFALESFLDEIAARTGEDPVAFRLRHMEDDRAIDVINAATDQAGWNPSGGTGGSGMGVSFALYTSQPGPSAAYLAYVAEVEVDGDTGDFRVTKLTCAIDCGLVINPDGVTNQVEGGVIQAMSWALREQVTFDHSIVTSHDWETYPILTFLDIPEIETIIINRPDEPAKGIGEPVTVPVAAAIANAIYDASGARPRELPFTPEKVRALLANG